MLRSKQSLRDVPGVGYNDLTYREVDKSRRLTLSGGLRIICAAARTVFQILWRAGMVNSNAMTIAHREKTDLLLQPPLTQIDMLNWKGFDRAIAAGYEYAVRRLATLPVDSPLQRSGGLESSEEI